MTSKCFAGCRTFRVASHVLSLDLCIACLLCSGVAVARMKQLQLLPHVALQNKPTRVVQILVFARINFYVQCFYVFYVEFAANFFISSSNIDLFSKFFTNYCIVLYCIVFFHLHLTCTLQKIAMQSLNVPHHLKRVSTLPYEILMSEN